MKKCLAVPVLALPLFAMPLAMAAEEARKETHKSTRLGVCSKEAHAKGLKGEERRKYISGCIASAKAAKAAGHAAPAP